MTAVFDCVQIATRRRELFGGETLPAPVWPDWERQRHTPLRHCGICPIAEGELCHLDCATVRSGLDDGVTMA